jgi:hypothetical protein
MRRLVLCCSLAFAGSLFAQEAAKKPAPELDKDTQTRIRVDRAAGGTGNITPEEKASANAGAGPHLSRPATGKSRKSVENKNLDKR